MMSSASASSEFPLINFVALVTVANNTINFRPYHTRCLLILETIELTSAICGFLFLWIPQVSAECQSKILLWFHVIEC